MIIKNVSYTGQNVSGASFQLIKTSDLDRSSALMGFRSKRNLYGWKPREPRYDWKCKFERTYSRYRNMKTTQALKAPVSGAAPQMNEADKKASLERKRAKQAELQVGYDGQSLEVGVTCQCVNEDCIANQQFGSHYIIKAMVKVPRNRNGGILPYMECPICGQACMTKTWTPSEFKKYFTSKGPKDEKSSGQSQMEKDRAITEAFEKEYQDEQAQKQRVDDQSGSLVRHRKHSLTGSD